MSEPKIKLFGIARMSDKAVLASECIDKAREVIMIYHAIKILSKNTNKKFVLCLERFLK
jgi:hypothetical protein